MQKESTVIATCCCEHIQRVFCLPLRLLSSTPYLKKSLSLCWTGLFFSSSLFQQYVHGLFHQCCVILLSTVDGGLSVPRIIINQLKWLDRVVDSKVVISVTKGGLRLHSDDSTVFIFRFVACRHL